MRSNSGKVLFNGCLVLLMPFSSWREEREPALCDKPALSKLRNGCGGREHPYGLAEKGGIMG